MKPEEIMARAMAKAKGIPPDFATDGSVSYSATTGEYRSKVTQVAWQREVSFARAALRALEEAGWKLYPPGQSSPRPRAMLDAAGREQEEGG